jgi:hypothetical protein
LSLPQGKVVTESPEIGSGGTTNIHLSISFSPSVMAPRQWSEGTSRHLWLHERGPAYQEAIHAKTKVAFLDKLYRDWFEKYHWSLDNKTEADPTAVYIDPIDEDGILKKNQAIVAKKEACLLLLILFIFHLFIFAGEICRL